MKTLTEVARDFIALLNRMEIPYAVMGGFAVRLYALPRNTFDVDFTALVERTELPALYSAATELGFTIPTAQSAGWIDTVRGFPVVKFQWIVKGQSIDVDVFLVESDFQRQLLARRSRHKAEDLDAWFVSAEDLILLKLVANRPKDHVDVGDILFVQGSLDIDYMRQWATILNVARELDEALAQVDQS